MVSYPPLPEQIITAPAHPPRAHRHAKTCLRQPRCDLSAAASNREDLHVEAIAQIELRQRSSHEHRICAHHSLSGAEQTLTRFQLTDLLLVLQLQSRAFDEAFESDRVRS
jgi:hypothetical protein